MFNFKAKLFSIITISIIGLVLCNCSAVLTPLPVGLFTSAKFPLGYESGYSGDKEYTVLGTAEGKTTANSIFGLIATGDASVSTAYMNAIKQFPEADCLTEISIDYTASSFLGLFGSMTTIVKGKAIRFQSPGYSRLEIEQQSKQKEHKKNIASEPKSKMVKSKRLIPKESNKITIEPKTQVNSDLTTFDLELIGSWELVSTKLPDGKIIDSESGLKGSLILSNNKEIFLVFEQDGREVEFEGNYYSDGDNSIAIEVALANRPSPQSKIYYKNTRLINNRLILKSETGKEYQWQKVSSK